MKPLLLIACLALASCATPRYPVPEPCKICDASTAPRHDAPVRLFYPDIPTPCGQPHPGWSPALRERMARERAINPTQTPMDYYAAKHDPSAPMPIPIGIERELLLWKPKR